MEVFRGECNFRGKEKSSVFSRVGGGVGGGGTDIKCNSPIRQGFAYLP